MSSAASSPASRPVPKGPTAASSSPTCGVCRKTLYEKVYCARGQAENLIKAHKLHLASDRTSCSKATANQFRLLIHTAAYWLMLSLRGLAPKTSFWRDAQFDTIRLCLIKVAGRVTEMVTRIKIALPSAFPYQAGFPISPAASPSCRRDATGRLAPLQTLRRNLKPRSPRPRRHPKPRLGAAARPQLRRPHE